MHNIQAQLKKYIDVALDNNNSSSKISFFIINSQDSKAIINMIKSIAKDVLGEYYDNDFLHVRDFSTQLKKTHNIKVAQKENNEVFKTLLSEYNYKDIGTREMNIWLQHSPASKSKILFIENIERMGISAINAFLKTCEEPLKNRIIIASTSNKSQILDTVLSRAIIINDTKAYTNNPNLADDLHNAIKVLSSDENIHNKHKVLSDINKKGVISQFLDELIAYYVSQNDFYNSEKWLKIKKMSTSNINMDNLLFYGILD